MKRLFGTDGMRGQAGKFPLDHSTIHTIGRSLAVHLAERISGRAPHIVIGRDTRESGSGIERDLISGFKLVGGDVDSAGVVTTPGVAFLTRDLRADAGVVISASHNPYQDNGIKIFEPSGRKLDDATERRIEEDIHRKLRSATQTREAGLELEQSDLSEKLRSRYVNYLADDVGRDLSLSNFTMVVDCANGAAYEIAPQLFRRLGAGVIAINNEPDGRNINLHCGSLHMEGLRSRVIEEQADIGVAFDGDADRALFIDASGHFVDGDSTLWVLAKYLKARGELTGNSVVATIMSNIGLEIALHSQGIKLARTDVGDKYVLAELIRSGSVLGGEQSGHIIFPRLSLAGDGLITAMAMLRVMREEGSSLAELTGGIQRYPQLLVNVRVREKRPFEELPEVQSVARQIETGLGDRGRLLLRYSGTEPLARIMIEGDDEHAIKAQADLLAAAIRHELGGDES